MRPEPHRFEAMGTSCVIVASDGCAHAGERWVRAVASRLTRFSADSELSMLNARQGEWVEISVDLEAVLRAAERAYELSFGLVNVAVLPSMLAVGYTRPLREGPTAIALEHPQPTPSLPAVLDVRPGRARLARGAGIDLGGIAKGWMADRLCGLIGSDCLVNLGGDLRAVGAWPVGFGATTLMLRDQAAATSSTRRRRWGEAHHLIDPRTGRPSRTGLEEVSVVTTTAFDAEVVAKTAMLLGPDHAAAYCAAHALAWSLDGRHDS